MVHKKDGKENQKIRLGQSVSPYDVNLEGARVSYARPGGFFRRRQLGRPGSGLHVAAGPLPILSYLGLHPGSPSNRAISALRRGHERHVRGHSGRIREGPLSGPYQGPLRGGPVGHERHRRDPVRDHGGRGVLGGDAGRGHRRRDDHCMHRATDHQLPTPEEPSGDPRPARAPPCSLREPVVQ